MNQIHIPMTPLGDFTNPMHYTSGRLNGNDGAQAELIVMPPDGVFLQTLRIAGFLGTGRSLFVELYR